MNRLLIVLLLTAAISTLAPAAEPAPPVLKVSDLQHKEDTAAVEQTDGKTTLRVKCPSGIGRMTVSVEKGAWPDEVVLFLEGLNELEHFTMTVGRMSIEGSRKSSGQCWFDFLPKDGDFQKRAHAGTLDIKVELEKEGVRVKFPKLLFADADTVKMSWINWLR